MNVRKKYSKEFKLDAVSLVLEQDYSRVKAARSLDINSNLLSRWKLEFEGQAGGELLSREEREELKGLRRENRELKMEKEILKKASAYFAKEMK